MKNLKKYPYLAQALQLGWVVAFSLLGPLCLGIWLDKRFGTAPLFILLSMVLGTLAATVGVARMVTRMFREMEKLDAEEKVEAETTEEDVD